MTNQLLRWIQRGLFLAGVSMLGYCGFVLADSWIFQSGEQVQFDRLLTSRETAPPGLPENPQLTATGSLIGRMDIPRLGLSAILMEGTSSRILGRAVGHIAGTSLPGKPGNVGIAGHRDTFFRPLRNIHENDMITLTTLLAEYRYRVVSAKVVDSSDVAVLNPGETEVLTLVTCYPFYFVGSAPDRFVVRAERII